MTTEQSENTLKLAKIKILISTEIKNIGIILKGTFSSYMHAKKNLSEIDKFWFLKSRLKGNPLDLIGVLPLE